MLKFLGINIWDIVEVCVNFFNELNLLKMFMFIRFSKLF